MGKTAAPDTNVSLLSRMAKSLPSVRDGLLDVYLGATVRVDHISKDPGHCGMPAIPRRRRWSGTGLALPCQPQLTETETET